MEDCVICTCPELLQFHISMIWRDVFMAMYIMKGLCVIGIILNVVLMIRKNKELRANPEKDPEIGLTGEELWQRGKQPWESVLSLRHLLPLS